MRRADPHDLLHPRPGPLGRKMRAGDTHSGNTLMKTALLALAATAFVAGPVPAQVPTGTMGELRPDQKQFFDLYKQLVETDTSITSVDDPANGGCTQAAAQIAARLKAAGF